MRLAWLGLGLASLTCGIAGIVLPLVPTTPFLLVAAFAFARSSERLHDWLVMHPQLGTFISDWSRYGGISRGAKVAALAVMIVALLASIASGVPAGIVAVQAVVLALSAAFVATRPEPPRHQ